MAMVKVGLRLVEYEVWVVLVDGVVGEVYVHVVHIIGTRLLIF